MIKNKIKEVPGLLFVTDSLEFMSAAGRRRMLEQPWMTARAQLDREQELDTLQSEYERKGTPAMRKP